MAAGEAERVDLVITATRLFAAGFADIISVIPPTGSMSPSSRIPESELGKAPGRRNSAGLWGGYDWRRHQASEADARKWELDGANIGIRTRSYPAIDIDVTDPGIASIVKRIALEVLGPAPCRVGRAPKSLLAYRTSEPFTRMRLALTAGDHKYLIEALGDGQQYVASGIHPVTRAPYTWDREDFRAEDLTEITRADVERFFEAVADALDLLDITCEQKGTGELRVAAESQPGLLAPSIDVLRDAVRMIPNDTGTLRDDYIALGHAIKAAAGPENVAEGEEIFVEWARSHRGGDGRVEGNPDTPARDWAKMVGPFTLGWQYVVDKSREHGFIDAALDFEGIEPGEDDDDDGEPPVERRDRLRVQAGPPPAMWSEQDLAQEFIDEHRGEVRAVPLWGGFSTWDGRRWEKDGRRLVESKAAQTLRRCADLRIRQAVDAEGREAREAIIDARAMCSAKKVTSVLTLAGADSSIVVTPDLFDADPWLLNTPSGIVDLRSGSITAHNPDALLTRLTGVGVDRHGDCPRFKAFILEACGGDVEMVRFIQRFLGYCLTGSVREHKIVFVWGPGGNGKSVLIEIVQWILGDYATIAPMDVFTAKAHESHPTELAGLQGRRLVTASETAEGKRWNTERLKSLSGGDTITARFMRQDFFTFEPSFKLLLAGNVRPELRNVDEAIRRRLILVPFVVRPRKIDTELKSKLKLEAAAILAWMIDGCLAWQGEGLAEPASIASATEEYFGDEDALGQWLDEMTVTSEEGFASTADLYESWSEWCGRTGQYVGTSKMFAQKLIGRGFERARHAKSRQRGFKGLTPLAATDIPNLNPDRSRA